MKLCIDCKHYALFLSEVHLCKNPKFEKEPSMVDGTIAKTYADSMRLENGCGREALAFEPRE
jgi:hypothetical protein